MLPRPLRTRCPRCASHGVQLAWAEPEDVRAGAAVVVIDGLSPLPRNRGIHRTSLILQNGTPALVRSVPLDPAGIAVCRSRATPCGWTGPGWKCLEAYPLTRQAPNSVLVGAVLALPEGTYSVVDIARFVLSARTDRTPGPEDLNRGRKLLDWACRLDPERLQEGVRSGSYRRIRRACCAR